MEIWKNITNYEDYQVSNLGNIKITANKASRKERILKPLKHPKGYFRVGLYKDKKIIGHCLDTKYHHIYNDNKWIENIVLQKNKLNKSDIIGFHSLNGDIISFKVLDNSIIKRSNDKRMVHSGVSCFNIDITIIESLFKKLNKEMPSLKNKSLICDKLEDILLSTNDRFYNLYNYSNIT